MADAPTRNISLSLKKSRYDLVQLSNTFQKPKLFIKGLEGEILFALFTDSNGMWRVMAVPVKDQQFESRLKLHEDWRALRDDDLCQKSAIQGCTFVHAAGFIGGNKTKEGALEMATKTIEASQK